MVYLDYSATTPVSKEVLDVYNKVSKEFMGNANSLHYLGFKSHQLMDESTKKIASLLGCKTEEVIFTSSASEANNMALTGVVEAYPMRNKFIVTTLLEHSSVMDTCSYLEKRGINVEYLKLDSSGHIDISDLEEKLSRHPLIVSVSYVNSEIGIIQDISKLSSIIKKYPLTLFHVDGTQAVGKIPLSIQDVDLFSFSGHKFFGPKGIACLIKKEKVQMEPLIHGGKSQSEYRAGTPALPLMVSMAKALHLSLTDLDQKYQYVKNLNLKLREAFENDSDVIINSQLDDSPYIFNISVPFIKPEVIIHALDKEEIYISSKTACSKNSNASISILSVYQDEVRASTSLRISLSYKTTEDEILYFIKKFNQVKNELINMKGRN